MDTIVMVCHLSFLPRSSHRPILKIKRFVGILINILLPQGSLLSAMMIFPCSVLCRLVINWFRLTLFWPLALLCHDSDQSSPRTQQTLIASLYHLTPSECSATLYSPLCFIFTNWAQEMADIEISDLQEPWSDPDKLSDNSPGWTDYWTECWLE